MSDYLDGLNEVQRLAVTNVSGPVLVVAGPGSGKTRVLTFRIAHMMEQGIAPWEILALTFTNKAAKEMKERIEKVVGQKANQVWAGTFHSIFARILRYEADKIGYDSNFTIYDSDDSANLISNIVKDMGLDKEQYNANTIRNRISSAKSNLVTPKMYENNDVFRQQDAQAKRPLVHAVYTQYVARCKRAGAMDFDDLLYRLYELLQSSQETLEKYRKRFQYVMVDEFQDTNQLQYAIIRKLVNYEGSKRNICVVGDDAQSIYAFRGATIQNILDFEQDFKNHGIQVFKLEQNYRSTEHIVQAANSLIQHNTRQIQKEIWSSKGDGDRIKVLRTVSDSEEGKRVVDTILEQKHRHHIHNKDIAILYRTNSQSRVFEEYLLRYEIKYKIFGGLSFYQRKEVKDVVAYLRLAVNPRDEEAFRRVVNYPRRGLGNTSIDKVSELAAKNSITLWEAVDQVALGASANKALQGFKTLIKDFGQQATTKDAYQVAKYVVKASGIEEALRADTSIEGQGRLDNFNALLDSISSFVEDDTLSQDGEPVEKTLTNYLQNIALISDMDTVDKDNPDFVSLMSVHAAKGLEFKSVFVVGLEENLFPSFMSMESVESIDEERRLFYVAVTRAERLLTLSYANGRYRYGQMRYNEPSRFLAEIPSKHTDSPMLMSGARSTTSGEKEKDTNIKTSSGVTGSFVRKSAPAPRFTIDAATFKPSPSSSIEAGMKVLHMKFGNGYVQRVEGAIDNRIATILFEGDSEADGRRIALKFAKLQIVE